MIQHFVLKQGLSGLWHCFCFSCVLHILVVENKASTVWTWCQCRNVEEWRWTRLHPICLFQPTRGSSGMEGRTRCVPVPGTACRGKLTEHSVKREDRPKKKIHCWHWEFVIGWKGETRHFNCLDYIVFEVILIFPCTVFYSNLYKYRYLFPQKVKSQIKRLLDIKKNKSDLDSETHFLQCSLVHL